MEEFVSGGIGFPGGALGVDINQLTSLFWIYRQKEKTNAAGIRFGLSGNRRD
jgi:hypothetical protein